MPTVNRSFLTQSACGTLYPSMCANCHLTAFKLVWRSELHPVRLYCLRPCFYHAAQAVFIWFQFILLLLYCSTFAVRNCSLLAVWYCSALSWHLYWKTNKQNVQLPLLLLSGRTIYLWS